MTLTLQWDAVKHKQIDGIQYFMKRQPAWGFFVCACLQQNQEQINIENELFHSCCFLHTTIRLIFSWSIFLFFCCTQLECGCLRPMYTEKDCDIFIYALQYHAETTCSFAEGEKRLQSFILCGLGGFLGSVGFPGFLVPDKPGFWDTLGLAGPGFWDAVEPDGPGVWGWQGPGVLGCLDFQELFKGYWKFLEPLALDSDEQEEPLDLQECQENVSDHSNLLDAWWACKNRFWSLNLSSTQASGYPWLLCTLQDIG